MKQYVLHTMPPLKPPNFKYKFFFFYFLPLADVQFDSRFGFASSSLPNVAFLSRYGSSIGSSNLPSCFSTSTSSNQSSSAQGLHVPCDPTNALTIGTSSFVELGTLGVTNCTNLCSSSSIGASSTQGPTFGIQGFASGTQGPVSRELTKKRKKEANIKKVFKEEWATRFSWVELVVDLASKIHMVCCKVCSLVEGKEKILNLNLDGL
jgi:hypothetical protein